MRVVFVINSLGAGGTERSTAVLLPYLRERGIDAVVLCLFHRDEGDEQSVRDQGFDVRIVGRGHLPSQIRDTRRLLKELRPDVVHTAIFEADIVGRIAAIGLAPVLTSLVNTPYDPVRRCDPNIVPWKLEVVRMVDALTGRACTDLYHAVTEGVADEAVATLHIRRDRIEVVERGRDAESIDAVTPEQRAAIRAELDVDDDAPLLLGVGRHEYQKGHVFLIEAMREIRAAHPRAVLAIAGREGNTTRVLDKAIRSTGQDDHIRLLGHRNDVSALLAAADVFVMPSLYEGTAGAAIEALALEVPIVASSCAGTLGVLIDGVNSLVVPPADSAALAGAVGRVLDEPGDAVERAKQGRLDFERRFTLDRSADRMAELYRRVVYR